MFRDADVANIARHFYDTDPLVRALPSDTDWMGRTLVLPNGSQIDRAAIAVDVRLKESRIANSASSASYVLRKIRIGVLRLCSALAHGIYGQKQWKNLRSLQGVSTWDLRGTAEAIHQSAVIFGVANRPLVIRHGRRWKFDVDGENLRDPRCQRSVVWAIDRNRVNLSTAGPMPVVHVSKDWLTDSWVVAIRWYGNLVQHGERSALRMEVG